MAGTKAPKNPTSSPPDITDLSATFLLSAHPSTPQPQTDAHGEKKKGNITLTKSHWFSDKASPHDLGWETPLELIYSDPVLQAGTASNPAQVN